MTLLPPLPPVLKRRSAFVLGTLATTALVIGGVSANAQAGGGHAAESTTVAAVGATPGNLIGCAGVDPSELRLTPARPATAVAVRAAGKPLSVKGIVVEAIPAKAATGKAGTSKTVTVKAVPATLRPAEGTAVKVAPGKIGTKALTRGGEAIATQETAPVCVTATKAR